MARRGEGQLRIIGGEHRSRLVKFDPDTGVRPTPDRVRQSLFDWLAPLIDGAHCLDLFGGSGALGLEALSRGAAHATFVETGAQQIADIRNAVRTLRLEERATVVQQDALNFLVSRLTSHVSHFDLVFLDPPYGADLLAPALAALPPHLKPGHRIYLEWPLKHQPALPAGLKLLREKKAGQVSYALATFEPT